MEGEEKGKAACDGGEDKPYGVSVARGVQSVQSVQSAQVAAALRPRPAGGSSVLSLTAALNSVCSGLLSRKGCRWKRNADRCACARLSIEVKNRVSGRRVVSPRVVSCSAFGVVRGRPCR